MPASNDSLSQARDALQAAQIALDPIESKFVVALAASMPEGKEIKEQATQVSSGLERLLMRHHEDSRLIVTTSQALGGASKHELPAFIQKLSRFTKHMDAPVAAHSLKTIKMAKFVHVHPEILEIKHIDSIETLSRLPEGSVTKGLKKGEIQVGGTAIRIARADPKEIADAVKKVREAHTEIRKHEKAERKALAMEEAANEEAAIEAETEDAGDQLKPQLSEAASALAKVLGSLSRNRSHPELSHVLSEARKLLMLAMRDDGYYDITRDDEYPLGL